MEGLEDRRRRQREQYRRRRDRETVVRLLIVQKQWKVWITATIFIFDVSNFHMSIDNFMDA